MQCELVAHRVHAAATLLSPLISAGTIGTVWARPAGLDDCRSCAQRNSSRWSETVPMLIPVMNRNLPSMPHAQPGLAELGSVDGAPARLSCRQHLVGIGPGRRSDCRRRSSYG